MGSRLALVACVRDEADALPAFLAHHAALGVGRAYLYLDRCGDRSRDVLRSHPWVETIVGDRDAPDESLERFQLRCADDALARARAEGVEWLLFIDADEFAWGGALDAPGPATEAGSLLRLLGDVAPQTEAVVLRTLEVVPRVTPPGTPFWRVDGALDGSLLVRDVLDPTSSTMVRLARPLGHFLGKSIVRVAADAQAYSAHRWTRRQDAFPPAWIPLREEERGCHFHYVVRDAAHWHDKYRKLAIDPDGWLRGGEMEFPKRAWKRAAAAMSRAEAEAYFATWVAVPDATIADAVARGIVTPTPHVARVLDEIGFGRTAAAPVAATRPPGVVFVGIDACDPALVRAWAAAGHLPTLARLLETAATAPTDPPEGLFVGAIWPSLYTARTPARHGVHCWRQLVPGTYREERFLARDRVAAPAFWDALARAGRRACVVDVPLAPRATVPGTVQVLEWGGHDVEAGCTTEPPELRATILAAVGPHPVGDCNLARDDPDMARLRDDLVAGVHRRTALHALLLAQGPWDCFATVYAESHCVGHQCWHLHDADHVRHDAAQAARLGDPVLDVYRAIDASLGALLAAVGDETPVVVALSHGMRPHYDPTHLLGDVLARLEALERLAPARSLRRRLALRVPALARRLHARAAELAGTLMPEDVRWFQVANNQVDAGIRVNRVGREPHGRVPAASFDAACAQLAAELATLVDGETGAPVVDRVVRPRDRWTGERLDDLPDLCVVWRKAGYVRHLRSRLIGDVVREYAGPRTGDHTPEGLLLVRAPGLRAGPIDGRIDVTDVAPTLCALLGVALPDVDGRPVAALLTPAPARAVGA